MLAHASGMSAEYQRHPRNAMRVIVEINLNKIGVIPTSAHEPSTVTLGSNCINQRNPIVMNVRRVDVA